MCTQIVGMISLALVLTMFSVVTCQESRPRFTWQPNLAEARKEAKRQKRLLMIFACEPVSFYSDKMEMTTFRDPEVVRRLQEKFILVKVVCNDDRDLMKTHKIDRFPTTIFESPSGEVLGEKHVGYQDARKMLQILMIVHEIAKERTDPQKKRYCGCPEQK